MRRVLFILLLVSCLAVPAASATVARTPGSAEIELRNGAGIAKIRYRGTLLGHVVHGRVVATNNVKVTGWEFRRRLSPTLIAYRGTDIYFRVYYSQGRWRIQLSGRGINAGGFVNGCMTLDGVDAGLPGRYRNDSPGFTQWPRVATNYRLGLGC